MEPVTPQEVSYDDECCKFTNVTSFFSNILGDKVLIIYANCTLSPFHYNNNNITWCFDQLDKHHVLWDKLSDFFFQRLWASAGWSWSLINVQTSYVNPCWPHTEPPPPKSPQHLHFSQLPPGRGRWMARRASLHTLLPPSPSTPSSQNQNHH